AEVLDLFRRANASKPMQGEVLVPLIPLLFQNNAAAEGEKLATDFLAQNKTYGPIYEILYAQYFRTKRLPEAEAILKQRIANSPSDVRAIIVLANHYVQIDRKADADAALQPLITDATRFPTGLIDAAEFYVARQDLDTATRLLQQGVQQNSKNPLPFQQKLVGIKLLQQRFDEALAIVDEVLKRDPNSQDAKVVRTKIQIASNDPAKAKQALEEYKNVVKGTPKDADLRILAARAYQRVGNLTAATTELREVTRFAPNNTEALILLGELAYEQRDATQVIAYADQALSINPNLASARMLRAIGLSRSGDFARANEEMVKLGRQYPNQPEIQIQTGRIKLDQGKYGEAQAIFQSLYKPQVTDLRVLRGLAESYLGQKKTADAVQMLEKEVGNSPIREQIRPLLAATQLVAGKPEEAMNQLKTAAANDPQSHMLLIQIAQLSQAQGKYQDAIANLQKATATAPQDPKLQAPLWGSIGFLQQSMGNHAEARATYEKVLQIDPENPAALNNTAFLIAETGGNLDQAQGMIERARRRDAKNPEFDDTLAWIYTKKNQPDSAIPIYQNLVKQYPKSPRFRYHLATALSQKGDTTQARQQLEAALASNPAPEEANRIREMLSKLR
ncbi:MAG: tetratricopeptide repeat protein, partial [Bryobacterales bacterium]|nr:tetratricopeptide repeat protein [Bryobacterales bacterium]